MQQNKVLVSVGIVQDINGDLYIMTGIDDSIKEHTSAIKEAGESIGRTLLALLTVGGILQRKNAYSKVLPVGNTKTIIQGDKIPCPKQEQQQNQTKK